MGKAVIKTPWHSWRAGPLPKGCRLCVEGKKLVLFVTGRCAQRCFYCPVQEGKFGKDVAFANEWMIRDPANPSELIAEVRLTKAAGAGITGGDPLADCDRSAQYIQLLKKEFGKGFHVHLYTPLQLVSREQLKKLHSAGLDEIRFHPNLDDQRWWPRLSLARDFPWSVGVEIPAIPGYGKKIKALIEYIKDKVDFININELELSDTQARHYVLPEMGFVPKDKVSYGVKKSQALGLAMARFAIFRGLPVHVCTASLKDGVQMKKRLIRRSRQVRLPWDVLTKDGTLIRGCAYLPERKPGIGYRRMLQSLDRMPVMKALQEARHALEKAVGKGNAKMASKMELDSKKPRILLAPSLAKKHSELIKSLGLVPAIVEEYPTEDAFEIDVRFL